MGYLIISGVLMLIVGVAAFTYHVTLGKTDSAGVGLAFLAILAGASFIFTSSLGYAFQVNKIHIAANKQALVVSIGWWRQSVTTSEPCKVKLTYNESKKQLLLPGSEKPVTPTVLDAICKE